MKLLPTLVSAAALALCIAPASAEEGERHSGPVFSEFGSWREVVNMAPLDLEAEYKGIFDVVPGSKDGKVNAKFDSAARWMNSGHAGASRRRTVRWTCGLASDAMRRP